MLHLLHSTFYRDKEMLIWGNNVVMPCHIVLNSIIIFSFSYCQSTPLSFSKFTRGLRSTIMFKCITCSWHKHIKFCCCLISTSRHNIIHCQSSSSQRFPNILLLQILLSEWCIGYAFGCMRWFQGVIVEILIDKFSLSNYWSFVRLASMHDKSFS